MCGAAELRGVIVKLVNPQLSCGDSCDVSQALPHVEGKLFLLQQCKLRFQKAFINAILMALCLQGRRPQVRLITETIWSQMLYTEDVGGPRWRQLVD